MPRGCRGGACWLGNFDRFDMSSNKSNSQGGKFTCKTHMFVLLYFYRFTDGRSCSIGRVSKVLKSR